MGLGIPADFINGPLADLGRVIKIFPVSKIISNIEGDETIELGPEAEITAVMYPRASDEHVQGAEGLFRDSNANLFSLPADNVQRNDVLKFEGTFWRVDRIIRRFSDESASTPIYDYSICFKHEGLPDGPVPGTGRFIGTFRGIPESADKGDWWYDSEEKQYKGHNGTSVVLLG